MILENDLLKILFNEKNITFIRKSDLKEQIFDNEDEFALHINANKKILILKSKDFALKKVNRLEKQIDFHYAGREDIEGIDVIVSYKLDSNILSKNISVSSVNETPLLRVSSLICKTDNPKYGGEGLPVFVNDFIWCGIEFPSAINEVIFSDILCHEAPYVTIKKYDCLPVIFGVNIDSDLHVSFQKYIDKNKLKKDKLKIYCDWGLHDDMDDPECKLTAQMTLDNIDRVSEISKKAGFKFDYYLMDAFWFELNQPYIDFKKETFPNGIKLILEKLEQNNLKFGLWFDINCIHEHLENLEEYSTLLGNGSLCLAEDKIYEYIRNAFIHHIKKNKVKLLKLDFAFFECKNPNHNHSIEYLESKQKSIQNFIKIVQEIRMIEPELRILCYNGWTTSLEHIGEVSKRNSNVISPYWTFYIDYLYCGDPRVSEIATKDFSNSICYYTDSMIWNFKESYMPLDCIDDHGTMTGDTPTIYFLGNKTLRLGWLMDMMRGSRKMHLYGDTYKYSGEDIEYLGYVANLFDCLFDNNYSFNLFYGDPRKEELYGYSAIRDDSYVVLINPSKDKLNISFKGNKKVKFLIKNGKISNSNEYVDQIVLNQEDYVLIQADFVCEFDDLEVEINNLCDVTFTQINPNETLLINTLSYNELYLNFYFINGKPIRTKKGYPDGLFVMENGSNLVPENTISLWSGISWLFFKLKGNSKVELIYTGETPLKIKYTLGDKKN